MAHQAHLIRGKVARVLSAKDVAINKGAVDGVQAGMIFKILSPVGASVEDPDTGEELGSVDLEKVRVKVQVVHERVSVASTYRTWKVNVGGLGPALWGTNINRKLFEPPQWETRIETFKVSENSIQELSEAESYVKVGDPIVQAAESELSADDD